MCVCVCVCVCEHVCLRARIVLLIQHATRIRHIVTAFVASLSIPYFSTLFRKRHDFRGGGGEVTEKKMLVFFFNKIFFLKYSNYKY
jgi:hypothetical protein